MAEDPKPSPDAPDDGDDLGLADLLLDAILELVGVQHALEQPPSSPERTRALAAVRAALAELQAVLPPDDWPRE